MSATAEDLRAVVDTETYDHRLAWLTGTITFGLAVAASGLAGGIALRITSGATEPDLDADTGLAIGDGLSGSQALGIGLLLVAVLALGLGRAAQQARGRLPRWLYLVIGVAHRVVGSIKRFGPWICGQFGEHPHRAPVGSTDQPESITVSFVAIVGGVMVTGLGATLAAGLGWQGLFAAAGVAGVVAALSGLMATSHLVLIHVVALATSIVSAGSFANVGITTRAWFVLGGIGWVVAVWLLIVGARLARPWAILGAIAIATVAAGVLSELDNTLSSLTSPGNTPSGFDSLAPLLEPNEAAERVAQVGNTWRTFRFGEETTQVIPDDHALRVAYVLIDSAALAVVYPLLLFVLARAIARRLGAGADAQLRKSILTVTQFALPIVLAIDIAENFTGTAAVQVYTGTDQPHADLADISGLLARLHWAASALKWIALLGSIVAILATAIWLIRRRTTSAADESVEHASPPAQPAATDLDDESAGPIRAGLLERWNRPYRSQADDSAPGDALLSKALIAAAGLLRATIALVVVTALAMRNNQAYDAIRALVNHREVAGISRLAFGQAALLVGLAIGVGLWVRFLGSLLVRQITRTSSGNVTGRVGHWLIVLAFALVFALFLDARGLLIPVGMYAALELLSLPLRPRRGRSEFAPRGAVAPKIARLFRGFADLLRSIGEHAPALVQRACRWGYHSWVAPIGKFVCVAWMSVLFSLGVVIASWIASEADGGAAVRWVLIVASGIIVVHATLFLALPRVFPDAQITTMVRRKRTTPATDDASQPAPTHEPGPPTRDDPAFVAAVDQMSAVLGALVPIIIGATIVRAALGLIIYGDAIEEIDNQGDWMLLTVGLLTAFGGIAVQGLQTRRVLPIWSQQGSAAAVRLMLAGLVAVYLLGWQTVSIGGVIDVTRFFGAIGVLLMAIAVITAITTAISYLGTETSALASLRLIGFKRPPFYLLILVWLLIGSAIDEGGYHNIPIDRTIALERAAADDPLDAAIELQPDDAFDTWVHECVVPNAGERAAVPMVFVAASGGGIRAAYWSASTLEQLDHEVGPIYGTGCNPVFAASGASGGSLGLAVYAVDRLSSTTTQSLTTQRLDDDYLSPALGWFLFTDLARPLFLWDLDGSSTLDRAQTLEAAWTSSWIEQPAKRSFEQVGRCTGAGADATPELSLASGLRETWCLGAPLLILNGAEVSSGCRFIASVLDNGTSDRALAPTASNCLRPQSDDGPGTGGPLGATIDLVDSICPTDDIELATAALLSARFPFVSPSGRVPRKTCGDDPGTRSDGDVPVGPLPDDPAFVVDGGYIDNSGASSLVELWAQIATRVDQHNAALLDEEASDDTDTPCIVPVFLQIDNGYDFDAATAASRPFELVVPLTSALAARGSREAEAKQVAASTFLPSEFTGGMSAQVGEQPVHRWFRVVPEAHPGIQAPLGWVLSDAAQGDLDNELEAQVRGGELAELIDLLTADLRCVPVG